MTSLDVTNALGFAPIPQFSGLGWNGTSWQDMTSSRVSNVTYTNSTGYPILVLANTHEVAGMQGYVNGVQIGYMTATQNDTIGSNNYLTFIVPIGATYKIYNYGPTNAPFANGWFELR